MKAPSTLSVAAILLAPLVCLAGEQAAAPQASAALAIPAMTASVGSFFNSQNLDPKPADLAGVVSALQRIGQANGPTREQMAPVIDRIRASADLFSGPVDPLEKKPAVGLASSVKLEMLAGPLKAWLRDGQKDFIAREQAEYSAKLTPQDRARLTQRMKAMAAALGLPAEDSGAAGASLNDIPFPTYTVNSADITKQMVRAIDAARTQIQLFDDPKRFPAPVQEALERAARRDVKILRSEPAAAAPIKHEKRFILDRQLTGELGTQEEGALLTERDVLRFTNAPRADAAKSASKPDDWKTHLLWLATLAGTILFVPLVIWLRVNYLP